MLLVIHSDDRKFETTLAQLLFQLSVLEASTLTTESNILMLIKREFRKVIV